MKAKKCVRCGFCCSRRACGFGSWNEERQECHHIIYEDDGRTLCAIHDEIIKDPTAIISPAFDCGCCMDLFNKVRDKVVRDHHDGINEIITVPEIGPLDVELLIAYAERNMPKGEGKI